MIGIYLGGLPKYGCILRAARGTWNFVRHLATLAQGCVSEVHMNMDVNLHRLPELILYSSKFLVPFTVFMLSLQLMNRAVTLYHKKTIFISNFYPSRCSRSNA